MLHRYVIFSSICIPISDKLSLSLAFLAATISCRAADLTWSGGAAPNDVWNTSSTRWNGGTLVWGGASDNAIFGGAGQTVKISASIAANKVTINSTDYIFQTNILTLGAGGIDTSALLSGTTTTFNSSARIDMSASQTWSLGQGTFVATTNGIASGGHTLTLNNTGTSTFNAVLTGTGSLVKTGTGIITLASPSSTFTGNVDIQQGTLTIAATDGASTGANTALGKTNGGSKTITVGAGATLAGTTNNWFGNGTGTTVWPTIILNGGALTSTKYTALGNLELNGATVSNTNAGSANFQGFALRGSVTVGGSVPSTISLGGAPSATTYGYHLGTNTNFNVADVTGNAGADLTIAVALRNQGQDFGSLAGALTKSGSGTLVLSGASTYTGATTLSAGTLIVTGSLANTAVTVSSGATLSGTGSIAGAASIQGGGIIEGGNGTGALTLSNNLSLADGSVIKLTLGSAGVHSSLARTGGSWSFDADQTFLFNGGEAGLYTGLITGLTGSETGLGTIGSWTISNPGWIGTFSFNSGSINLNLTTIPEPNEIALFLAGAVVLIRRRRSSGGEI